MGEAISLFAFAQYGRDPNYVRSLKYKNLKFFGQKPSWSRTEALDDRGLTVLEISKYLISYTTIGQVFSL